MAGKHFLAETGGDLRSARRLKRDLLQSGYVVLPDRAPVAAPQAAAIRTICSVPDVHPSGRQEL
jgi:hypothetical protein